MKKIILLFLLILHSLTSFSQYTYLIDFEDTATVNNLYMDTLSNPNCIWQIGQPQKNIFNTAYSVPNVIVTDSVNSYPINDTSSFIVKKTAYLGLTLGHTALLSGQYQVNSDSLNDYGLIEFSPDNGMTWINLLTDTTYSAHYIWYGKPTLTGNSNGWQTFSFWHPNLGAALNIQWGDTIQYRFTFISDSIIDTLDGLMFDNLYFDDWIESVDNKKMQEVKSNAYPNPTVNTISIQLHNPTHSDFYLKVFDRSGRTVLEKSNIKNELIKLNTSNLSAGIYYYELISRITHKRSRGVFIRKD